MRRLTERLSLLCLIFSLAVAVGCGPMGGGGFDGGGGAVPPAGGGGGWDDGGSDSGTGSDGGSGSGWEPPADSQDSTDATTATSSTAPPASDTGEETPPLGVGKVRFTAYPPVRSVSKGSYAPFLQDVLAHTRQPAMCDTQDTTCHESTHRNCGEISGKYFRGGRGGNNAVAGFYVGNDRAVIIEEPPCLYADVKAQMPSGLKVGRYKFYVEGGWQGKPSNPLYVFDEWVAYVAGARTGLQLAEAGRWRSGGQDCVKGCLEFTVISFALAKAVATRDPAYWKKADQMRNFMAWFANEAMGVHRKGMRFRPFQGFNQAEYLRELQSGASSEALRSFIKANWGEEFWNRVFMGR